MCLTPRTLRDQPRNLEAVFDQEPTKRCQVQAVAGNARRKGLAVFVSGGGSNFRAIHEAALGGAVHGDVVTLVTDKPGCGGAEHARRNGIPVVVFPKSKAASEGISIPELLNTLRYLLLELLMLSDSAKKAGCSNAGCHSAVTSASNDECLALCKLIQL